MFSTVEFRSVIRFCSKKMFPTVSIIKEFHDVYRDNSRSKTTIFLRLQNLNKEELRVKMNEKVYYALKCLIVKERIEGNCDTLKKNPHKRISQLTQFGFWYCSVNTS